MTLGSDTADKTKKEKRPSVKFSDQVEKPTQSADVTVLVLPPLALKNELWNEIKARYEVIETMKFDINLVSKKARRPVLVVAASLDGIAEACKTNKLKVLVYKLDNSAKNNCANNYYLGLDNFYANEKLRENQLSAATIRSHVDRMLKARS